MAIAVAKIEEVVSVDTRQEAKAALEQAQQSWVRTRNADCQSEIRISLAPQRAHA